MGALGDWGPLGRWGSRTRRGSAASARAGWSGMISGLLKGLATLTSAIRTWVEY